MTTFLSTYPTYKDSGMQWLGKVPIQWKMRRIKLLFKEKDERAGKPKRVLLSLTRSHGLLPQSEASKRIASVEDLSNYRVCRPGDLVMNRMQAWSGMFAVSSYHGVVSPDYCVFKSNIFCDVKFFEYLFKTQLLSSQFALRSRGVGSGFNRLYTNDFGDISVPVPPPLEQGLIVRFLDSTDRYVNHYIRAKQNLIKLLEGKRQTIIQSAVARGLDPNVSRKPSGIEWVGAIPRHWTVTRLRAVLSRPTQNGLFKRKDHFGRGVPLINVADVYRDDFQVDPDSLDCVEATSNEIQRFQVLTGDIFFVRSSLKTEGTGRSTIARNCSSDTVFECHLVQARPNPVRVNPRYLVFQLNAYSFHHYLVSRANIVTMSTISQNVISTCPILVPPLLEQDRIVDWIDIHSNQISQAIEHTRKTIAHICEYRTRLISDVVTGKLDVREAAAQLPKQLSETGSVDAAHGPPHMSTGSNRDSDASTEEDEP